MVIKNKRVKVTLVKFIISLLFTGTFTPPLYSAQTPGRYKCFAKVIIGQFRTTVVYCSSSIDDDIYLYRSNAYKRKRTYFPYTETSNGTYSVAGDQITFTTTSSWTDTLSVAGDTTYIIKEYSPWAGATARITYRWFEDVLEEAPSSGNGLSLDTPSEIESLVTGSVESDVVVQAGDNGRINPENSAEEGTVSFTPSASGTVDAKIFSKDGTYVDGITFDVNAGETTGIVWDGRDADRNPVASGSYNLVIQGGGKNLTIPLAVVK